MLIYDIGPSIRKLRKEQKLTQAQLAKLGGISRVTIGKIERGEFGSVSFATVATMLQVLGYELKLKKRTTLGIPTLDELPNAGEQE